MLKILLYAYVSLAALTCLSQETVPDWSSPAELVVEDPGKNVTDLNAVNNDNRKVMLSWQVAGSVPDFFCIERSENAKNFEVVAVLNKLEKQKVYQWADEAPKKGKNYYRLRYSFGNGDSLYSKTIPVIIAGEIEYKFYPNPVDHILIVKAESPIDVHISDATGKVRISHTRVQGIYTINVSSLEKGVYLIRFSNKLTNVMSQEKLIKN